MPTATNCPHCDKTIREGAYVLGTGLGYAHQECAWCVLLAGMGIDTDCRCASRAAYEARPYPGAVPFTSPRAAYQPAFDVATCPGSGVEAEDPTVFPGRGQRGTCTECSREVAATPHGNARKHQRV